MHCIEVFTIIINETDTNSENADAADSEIRNHPFKGEDTSNNSGMVQNVVYF